MVSLKQEYTTENGMALNEMLPKLNPLNQQYKTQYKRYSEDSGFY
ncbi:hypothetical protein CSB69_1051 [Morganella morganii]|nr:hypothetical protein CSB69_1051 [Morganella morganii]EMP50973.1 hypothetical protein C790_01997 [Morganella morganii SC01]